jgi:hypothetical protein
MKLTNWKRGVASALLAAGIWAPSVVQAANIPLGDPSFEAYTVPTSDGYAYANQYRPTSAWVGNPDGSGPLDGGFNASNWMFNSAYAETPAGSPPGRRAHPRTGNQAMHGRGFYNGQETSAVFEAGKTYKFSIFAQGDENAAIIGNNIDGPGWDSRVWLYLYDGSIPFSEANSLKFARYSPAGDRFNQNDFINRPVGSSAAQSQADWQQITLSWTVQPGAPEIGHPVGVAFWAAPDAGLDDASLAVVPEPACVVLVGMAGVSVLTVLRRKLR